MIWVRNQSREDLVLCKDIGIAYRENFSFIIEDGYFVCEFLGDYHTKLGKYSTKEKALKVLDMIQQRICDIKAAETKAMCCPRSVKELTFDGFVFQMPQDCDVVTE